MAKGKLILICQSGGEFITKNDGTMSYERGEANAVNINHETVFDDLKLELAEMSNLDQKTITIKYFLPGNRRNLITLRNDKDLKRMIDFHGNSVTADIFVNGKEGFDHDAIKVQATKNSGVKLADTVNQKSAKSTAGNVRTRKSKRNAAPVEAPVDTHPPVNVPDGSTAAADKTAYSSSPSHTSTSSPLSSEHDSDDDRDYRPRSVRTVNSALDMDASPADTVKKRRRTSAWMIGDHGPTTGSVSNNDRRQRRRKKPTRRRRSVDASDSSEDHIDDTLETDDLGSPSDVAFCDDDLPEKLIASWKDCITGVGQDFKSVKEFRAALQRYAVAHRFGYKLKKNDTNRASGICVEEGCSWSIHASWVPTSQTFRIRKHNDSHTCGGESWKNAHPAKNLLVSVIKNKLRESPHHKPKQIAKSISEDFGIQLKYTQVRRGMQDAREQLQGSYKESYNRLPWFCNKLVETNPGSLAKMTTNDEKRLQFLFVSFHSRIQSFLNGCRPILFLNATSLKTKYQESLLTATAVDADDGFFPVAFCIVDDENEESWRWFLEQLKSAISTSLPLTFVSDWEKGLKNPVSEIFENAYHGYSIYHLLESFKNNLRGPFQAEGRGVLPAIFLAAAHSVRLGGFKKFTEQIRQISSNAYDWVVQIEPEHWASLFFKGEPYNYILQNVGEPYSKLLDDIREATIMQKIEALMNMTCKLIKTRQEESSKWKNKLTPSKVKRLQEEAFKAQGLRVFISSDVLFEVHDDSTHVVNIEKWECTCLEWKQSGLPCRHAVAALNSVGKSIYDYCSKQFTVENYRITYSESINLIPDLGAPFVKEEMDSGEIEVLPPTPRSPKKELVKTEDPDKRTVTCSRCKELGHNKASCKATIEGTNTAEAMLTIEGTTTAEGTATADGTTTIEGTATVEDMAIVEVMVTNEVTETAESMATAEGTATVDGMVTTEDTATVDGMVTAEDTTTVDGMVTAEDTDTVDGIVTAEDTVTVDGMVTTEDTATIDGTSTVDVMVTAEDMATVEDMVIAEGTSIAEDTATVGDVVTTEGTSTAEDTATVEDIAITEGTTTAEGTSIVEDIATVEGS